MNGNPHGLTEHDAVCLASVMWRKPPICSILEEKNCCILQKTGNASTIQGEKDDINPSRASITDVILDRLGSRSAEYYKTKLNCHVRAILRLIEEPREISCIFRSSGFCCAHDSVWLPQRRRSQGAYGAGARRVFSLPGIAAC